uniref:Uncharacterized protein n=1 Tax=Aegilops tauschii subsp. strangulata TaxID=200361 RepID=A0A453GF36_AEGTS
TSPSSPPSPMAAATMIPSTLAECEGYDEAFLLEVRCHIANRPNATTAWGATSSRLPIQGTPVQLKR